MPDAASPPPARCLVSNTTPLIALTAATGGLDVLRHLYQRVVVPLEIQPAPVALQPFLYNSLDKGEAAVIQTALNLQLPLVCIDEAVGRRIARLCDLQLTGSVGILIKAKNTGYAVDMQQALDRMRQHGIWLSDRVVQFALSH